MTQTLEAAVATPRGDDSPLNTANINEEEGEEMKLSVRDLQQQQEEHVILMMKSCFARKKWC